MNMLAVVRELQNRVELLEKAMREHDKLFTPGTVTLGPCECVGCNTPDSELAGQAWPPTPNPVHLDEPNDGTEEPYRQLDLGLSIDGMGGVVVSLVGDKPPPVVAATTYG